MGRKIDFRGSENRSKPELQHIAPPLPRRPSSPTGVPWLSATRRTVPGHARARRRRTTLTASRAAARRPLALGDVRGRATGPFQPPTGHRTPLAISRAAPRPLPPTSRHPPTRPDSPRPGRGKRTPHPEARRCIYMSVTVRRAAYI